MKRGLIIGKFMPLHAGHVALIRFAASQCDELIVSMTHKPEDPIPGPIRFEWIKEEFKTEKNIRPEISVDDFDDELLPLSLRIPTWAGFLRKRFTDIHVVFSSENYGTDLAVSLDAIQVSFDPERKLFPVSAKLIREKPFRYWNFIALPARAYFVKKICFYGPESTGKSTLARKMAEIYETEFVPEVSRELITSNDFTLEDIVGIGHAQTERVLSKVKSANKLLFCDTDLITTQIYCRHYLKEVPAALFELERMITYDQYFLFDIDVPWIPDGLRDLGDKRKEMFEVFRNELVKRKIHFEVIKGDYSERESRIRQWIDSSFY